MKIYNITTKILTVLLGVLVMQCSDVLDKQDLSAFNEDSVWTDANLAEGFINQIHNRGMNGWPTSSAGFSDDAHGTFGEMYGETDTNSRTMYDGAYRLIRDINIALEELGASDFESEIKDPLMGQAFFFRAKIYFDLISTYGGVPLVLEIRSSDEGEALNVARNKTTECMAQIRSDIDTAIGLLPDAYDDASSDYGRITKGAAMAYKGRILNHWASEQFDPAQNAGRWQDAFAANQAALSNLEANGKGLNPDFEGLWFDESAGNVEAIMVRRYTENFSHNREAGCRPFVVGTNGESYNKATKGLVDAFPMKDGKSINDATSAYTYDPVILWENRDPRFTKSIAWNSAIWDLNDPSPVRTSVIEWTFQESSIEAQADARITPTGFHCRKAVNGSVPGGAAALIGTTDWIEIRFAEVLLNLAEAANEVGGNSALIYDILTDIRERAGIDAGGDNLYGLQAGMNQSQLRAAIMLERRLELAFEGKRSYDLRRRRMYEDINGTHRRGYYIVRTAAFDALDPSDEILDDRIALENMILGGSIDINDAATYNTYFDTEVQSVERFGNTTDDGDAIDYQDKYYFWDLPQTAIDRNPSLVQTSGWPGGSFDPLQ